MATLDAKLQELLSSHKGLFTVQENGKIKCEINGHTLPPRCDVVSTFLQGPKFQKLLKRYRAEDILKKYEPFIVPSMNFPLMLYCALTGQLIDKSVEAVKQHMQGKKFMRAKERFTNDQIDLKQEPTLESFGVRLPKEQQNGSTDHQQHEQQQQQGRADTDEADFWRPSKEEDSSSGANGAASESGSDAGLTDEGEGSDREVDAMDGVEAAAAAAEAGSSAEPMDEDKPRGRRKSAINTGHQAVGQANGSIKSKKQPCNGAAEFHNKQQQAGARIGVSKTEKKKQNINRPSAAKKVKR
eukprot:GHRR01002454.1.p1 GENE.GHRR01002454.1~~GHRR01002454.1.p1  ORF type:complete len:298 (+),score=104.82 GHRR01002454.1:153-1046(+)